MSTKTTFKRVALVVAAAVSFGGVSAVASHAAGATTTTPFYVSAAEYTANGSSAAAATETALQVAGVGSYVELTAGSDLASGKQALVTLSGAGATFATAPSGWVNVNTTTALSNSNSTNSSVLRIYTPTVGTVVATVALFANGSVGSTLQTITITVEATASHGVYSAAKSTVYAYTGDASSADSATATTDAAFSVSSDSGDASTKVASFVVTQNDANGDVMADGSAKAVTVYTTGGKLYTNTYVGSYATVAAGTAAVNVFKLSPNGVVGTATVTISVNGTVAKTYSVTFTSSVAKTLSLTAANVNIATSATASNVDAPLGTLAATPTYVLVAKDLNGNTIKGSTLAGVTAKSSDTTVAATPTIGTYNADLGGYPVYTTGALAGTATLSVTSDADSTITASGPVNVVAASAATLALTLDNTSYGAGDLVTATLTATNAAGKPVADGTYLDVLTGALSSNQSLPNGATPKFATLATSAKFVNGVATATFYAPGSSFTVKATTGAGAGVASAAQGASLSASATVVNAAVDAANAAADAAAEATDAANAATDAANNAMDSADAAQQAAMDAGDKADAALAAITDLASKVQSFITDISAQIKALATAVAKIKSKVKA